MHWTTFGLPVGNALVLVAILNSVCITRSILNFAEVAFQLADFSGMKGGLIINLIALAISVILTTLLWIIILRKGYCFRLLYLWIAGAILFVLADATNSTREFILSYSNQNQFSYWRFVWNTIFTKIMDLFLILIACQAAKLMKTKFIPTAHSQRRENPLLPIGLGSLGVWNFYKKRVISCAKLFLTLEAILSLVDVALSDHPLSIAYKEGYGFLPDLSEKLNLFEDIVVRVLRIILSIIALWILKKPRKKSICQLRFVSLGYLVATIVSVGIVFSLFGTYQELTVSVHFHQFRFIVDIFFRVWILALLVKCIDKQQPEDVCNTTVNREENEIQQEFLS